jgi:asparagine synthase (glutamine-hydrolysing)
MCGIAGYTGDAIEGLLARMINVIRSRGPDATGALDRGAVQLGHTRLSIVDLSPTGAQPMVRLDGRIAVSYNGEIYNYDELRRQIEDKGYRFEGHSDSELLPLGFAAFGFDLFRRLRGMFALALHDAQDNSLYLVRDQFGIKPLYYSETDGRLIFSSSARAVAMHPSVDRTLDESAIRDFLVHRYVPNGQCFYRGVKTLSPGTVARWHEGALTVRRFWSPPQRQMAAGIDRKEWVDRFGSKFEESVTLQLRSDVPIGVFLSGGIDSAAITHFAARHSSGPLRAFTFAIGDHTDETAAARSIAADYGAEHQVIDMPPVRPLTRLFDAITCMDLPVGDAIILPTYLLCEAAARDRKVVLTGEGADELFGGYVHVPVLRMLDKLAPIGGLARAASHIVRFTPPALLNPFFDYQAKLGQQGRDKVADLLRATGSPANAMRIATSIFSDKQIEVGTHLAASAPPDADLSLSGLLRNAFDTWLPNQILNKMDQLSMAHGLEARVPYLDPEIYELLVGVPDELLLARDRNKILLRDLVRREGLAIADRPKLAFHLPVERLYAEELECLADDWLSDDVLRSHGIVKPTLAKASLELLRHGDFVASKQVVAMIGLHMWLESERARIRNVALG